MVAARTVQAVHVADAHLLRPLAAWGPEQQAALMATYAAAPLLQLLAAALAGAAEATAAWAPWQQGQGQGQGQGGEGGAGAAAVAGEGDGMAVEDGAAGGGAAAEPPVVRCCLTALWAASMLVRGREEEVRRGREVPIESLQCLYWAVLKAVCLGSFTCRYAGTARRKFRSASCWGALRVERGAKSFRSLVHLSPPLFPRRHSCRTRRTCCWDCGACCRRPARTCRCCGRRRGWRRSAAAPAGPRLLRRWWRGQGGYCPPS